MTNYVIDVVAADLAFEVWLNGILLAEFDATGGRSWHAKIDGWVTAGSNQLEVRLASAPPSDPPVTPSPRFKLELRRIELGPSTEADASLATYQWSQEQTPLTPVLTPVFRAAPPLTPLARWRWIDADRLLVLRPEDQTSLLAILGDLARALTQRDVDQVLKLQAVQLEEMAIVTGQDPAALIDHYSDFLRERMGSADWRVESTPAAQLSMTGMAGGRLWHVSGPGGIPPVRGLSDGSLFGPDPYFSRLSGQWTIVL